ncbi:MAG TPA: hypothetical protein VGW11_10620 [Solirubrobacteraceae bacterium]|nr:hypothetical protein [Solirubrobacteraceae bacterium]
MNESSDSSEDRTPQPDTIRTEEPKAPFGADEPNPSVVSDETVEEQGNPEAAAEPGKAGYVDRDPAEDMPAVPTAPETQGEAPKHGGTPNQKKEPWGSE